MKNSELQIVVISFSDDFTKNSESLITTPKYLYLKILFKYKCFDVFAGGVRNGGILSFISIQYQFNLHDQFLLFFFQKKIIDDKSKDGALWSILCSIHTLESEK